MSDKPSVVEALSAVMQDVQAVRKGERNDAQNFNFRGIDSVINAVGPKLREHKVVVLPELVDVKLGTVEVGNGDRRRPIGHVVVQVKYRFIGPAGDELSATVPGEAMDSGDKAIAKAMSVAYRIALLQALCIPTDEPDPDTQVYERAPAAPAEPLAEVADRAEIVDAIRNLPPEKKGDVAQAWNLANLPADPRRLLASQVARARAVLEAAAVKTGVPEQAALEMESA